MSSFKTAILLAALALPLQGCLALGVAGAAVGVAGAAVGTAQSAAGTAATVTNTAVRGGMAIGRAVTPDHPAEK